MEHQVKAVVIQMDVNGRTSKQQSKTRDKNTKLRMVFVFN